MISLRTAKDDTYIAQLVGRMVRSPLARRIESDETLNRVRLYLPNFNQAAVTAVKEKLESDEGGLPTDVEINSVDAPRNPKVPVAAFAVVEALPSYQVPGPIHRSQVVRLHKLAALLVGDSLLPDAIRAADAFLVSVLEAERGRLKADGALDALISDVETATVEVMEIAGDDQTITTEHLVTDIADVNRLFAGARRKFRHGLADKYWGYRVTELDEDPYDAKTLVIAISSDTAVVEKVETEAADRVRQWLDTHGDAISALSEDKKAKYAEVRAMAREPELVNPGLPAGPISMTGDTVVTAYGSHLYADAKGDYRVRLGTWEKHVIAVESAREGFTAWYRNPTGGQRALRIPYDIGGGGYGKFYPDFLFIHETDEGTLRGSIIDPHGHHFADAADKLRGLASFAAKHGDAFARVVGAIRNADNEYRMLDLKDATIRTALSEVHSKDEIEMAFSWHGAVYS